MIYRNSSFATLPGGHFDGLRAARSESIPSAAIWCYVLDLEAVNTDLISIISWFVLSQDTLMLICWLFLLFPFWISFTLLGLSFSLTFPVFSPSFLPHILPSYLTFLLRLLPCHPGQFIILTGYYLTPLSLSPLLLLDVVFSLLYHPSFWPVCCSTQVCVGENMFALQRWCKFACGRSL